MLSPDRYFDPNPQQRQAALDLYSMVKDLPIVSPHGHVDPTLFVNENSRFGNPVELLIQPDHYVLRMLYSQGISYDQLLSTENPREIWRLFAENFFLFAGTPSGGWLNHELESVFGIEKKLTAGTADEIYDHIEQALQQPDFSPRAMFERLNIEILATTDAAYDTLSNHQSIQASGWKGRIVPTFRPDAVTNLAGPNWQEDIARLSQISKVEINDYASFIRALEHQRQFFKSMGATSTDSGVVFTSTHPLSPREAEMVFQRALSGESSPQDAVQFTAHMLYEMARMSVEDGLVMQLHPGSARNHNPHIFNQFGADRGFDIPISTEYTNNLKPILESFGNHPNFRLILFTLDESNYARELAPLAGAYPSVLLGPPWWFHDSWNGMRRFFDQVMETAGVFNTAGFNDDTRAFLSIPARHDVWRRASANWLAGLLVRGMIDREDAEILISALAVGLAKKAYNFH